MTVPQTVMILLNEKQHRTALGLTLHEECVAGSAQLRQSGAGLEGVGSENAETQALNDRRSKIVKK